MTAIDSIMAMEILILLFTFAAGVGIGVAFTLNNFNRVTKVEKGVKEIASAVKPSRRR